MKPDYDSPQALKVFLEQQDMAMQKKFGQNFLINPSLRKKLIDELDLEQNTTVWEIGPGLGSMTDEILGRKAIVTAFEIDRGFCSLLPSFFPPETGFTLVEGDVLKTWKPWAQKYGLPQRLFGNLPYNIGAVILADFISNGIRFDIAVVTLQKEVAQRMSAECGSEHYSSFSALCCWAYEIKTVTDLAGGSFWPPPRVDSRAVKLVKRENFPGCENPQLFIKLLRTLFSSRRKTVKNNLCALYSPSQLDFLFYRSGIDPRDRAETIPLEKILLLSDIALELDKS